MATDHVDRFKRWRSLRAYAILNTLEVFFWIAVIGLTFFSVSKICVGVNCTLGVFVALVSMVMVYASLLPTDCDPRANLHIVGLSVYGQRWCRGPTSDTLRNSGC